MNQELVAEILALPASDGMLLAEVIWDSIDAAPEALELTQWQKDELDRRLAEFEADPESGATLEEVSLRSSGGTPRERQANLNGRRRGWRRRRSCDVNVTLLFLTN